LRLGDVKGGDCAVLVAKAAAETENIFIMTGENSRQ